MVTAPARAMNSTLRANVGATVVHARDTMAQVLEKAKSRNGANSLWWKGTLLGLIPVVGIGFNFYYNRAYNAQVAANQKEAVAEHLGLDPRRGGVKQLERAAKMGDVKVKGIVNQIDRERDEANRSNTLATAGAGAVGLATGTMFLPGASSITSMIATEGMKMGGAVAGGAVSTLMNKDQLEVTDTLSMIQQKRKAGQPIDAHDVMMLRIAQNPDWQKKFKSKHGHPFHKMPLDDQKRMIMQLPDYFEVPQHVLDGVNRDMISPEHLLDPKIGGSRQFTAAMPSNRPRGTFANMVDDRRAAQAALQATGQVQA